MRHMNRFGFFDPWLASWINNTVAANAQRQVAILYSLGAIVWKNRPHVFFQSPRICVRTPNAMCSLSCTYKAKGLVKSGSPKMGAIIKALFVSSNLL